MPIVASCVSFQKVIVAEDRLSAQSRPVVMKMLDRLPRHDTRVSYQFESSFYHFLVENEIVYLCVTDSSYQGRTVFGFLGDVRDKFKNQFAGSDKKYPAKTELTPKNCGRFSAALAAESKTYNENPEADKIGRIKEQIDSVKQVMLENLDNVIERGDRIENLCDKTEQLKEEAIGFHSNARTLKRKMIMRNVKICIAIIGLIGILALVISFVACGINFAKCKSSPAPAGEPAVGTPNPMTSAPFTSTAVPSDVPPPGGTTLPPSTGSPTTTSPSVLDTTTSAPT
jgi:vesicle-associated membrane protein 7